MLSSIQKYFVRCAQPVNRQCCGDIGFLLDFHHDVDRLRIDTEVHC